MPVRKVQTDDAAIKAELAEQCAKILEEQHCEVGEAYDWDIPNGVSREIAQSVMSAAASQVLGRKLTFLYREENGTRYLRFYVTGLPVKSRKVSAGSFESVFELQDHFEQLIKYAKPGSEYEIPGLKNISVASAIRNLDAAGRRVLGRRLDIAYKREADDSLTLRYKLTDTTAVAMPHRSRRMPSLAERPSGWRPRTRKSTKKKESE